MSRTWSEILVPVNGTYTVATTASKSKVFYAINVTADTVFSEILNDKGVNVASTYIDDITKAVKAGILITLLNGSKPFTGIKLTSGQVTLVL